MAVCNLQLWWGYLGFLLCYFVGCAHFATPYRPRTKGAGSAGLARAWPIRYKRDANRTFCR